MSAGISRYSCQKKKHHVHKTCFCLCFADGSRAHKEELVQMRTQASLSACSDHIRGHQLKKRNIYHCWFGTSAKTMFVPNDHHDQQRFSSMESATFPCMPPYPVFTSFFFFSFLLNRFFCSLYCYLIVPLVLTDRGLMLRVVAVTEQGYGASATIVTSLVLKFLIAKKRKK